MNKAKKNNSILIVGGNSGIGLSLVKKMQRESYDVYVCDKKDINLDSNTSFFRLDLKQIDRVVEFAHFLEYESNITDMVYSAGYQDEIDILDLGVSDWDDMYKVHVLSAFIISQALARKMIKNNTPGVLVYISSIHGEKIRELVNYSATKAAQNMIMKEFAYRIADCGGRAFSVAPGSINTPLLRKSLKTEKELFDSAQLIPLKRLGTPAEIADSIYSLIQMDYLTGTVVTLDGGLSLTM